MELEIDYICALTNLYGHVVPARVCEVYNQQNEAVKDPIEFEEFLLNPNGVIENRYVYIKDGKFIDEVFYLSGENYLELRAKQEGKPHYVPEKEQLLSYVNPIYWEKPLEFKELEEYIATKLFPKDEAMGKKLVDETFYYITEDNFNGAIQTLNHYELVLYDKKESDPLLNILQRLNNNTRMRVHNAFTPIEISKITGESVYILPDRLLEDDNDCHCGSKNKYFECHQEADSKIRRLNDFRKNMKEA